MRTSANSWAISTIEILIAYAIEAPSSHNTQPWRFEVDGVSRVFVHADRARQLTVGDPAGRELVMSCGAAIENFVIAARTFGFDADVQLLPATSQPDCLAAIVIAPGAWPDDEEGLLFDAIGARRTSRQAFATGPVEPSIVDALAAAATHRGASLLSVGAPETRARLRALIGEADGRLFASVPWRRELASWVRTPNEDGDGMRLGAIPAPLARVAIQSFDVGARARAADGALVDHAPVLAVLTTSEDSTRDWLNAGRALERVLLTATRHGLQAGFLNQACQVPALRDQLRELALGMGYPQAVLRFGPARPLPRTPRRRTASVLVPRHR